MKPRQAKSGKGLKAVVVLYVVFIYATLPVMRAVLGAATSFFGVETFRLGINVLIVVALASLVVLAAPKGPLRIAIAMLFIGCAAAVIFSIGRTEERIHFIEYALLGVLVVRATAGTSLLRALIIVAAIGSIDEAIQWALPNRVGDLRDVMMNIAGGSLGIWFGKPSR